MTVDITKFLNNEPVYDEAEVRALNDRMMAPSLKIIRDRDEAIRMYSDHQKERAKAVFDAFNGDMESSDDRDEYPKIIKKNLDIYSLSFFVELVCKGNEKSHTAALGRQGGEAKKEADIDFKQAAKREIKKRWEEWRENPDAWPDNPAFARDMQGVYPKLESKDAIVIRRWCRLWDKE